MDKGLNGFVGFEGGKSSEDGRCGLSRSVYVWEKFEVPQEEEEEEGTRASSPELELAAKAKARSRRSRRALFIHSLEMMS